MALEASVLIPSYNDRNNLVRCIESLCLQSYPADRFEVIVVIDGSTDGSAETLAWMRTPFRLQVIEQHNRGRAAALNRAGESAKGDILIITDSDVLANLDFVKSHVEAHHDGDVVIGPIPLSPLSPVNFLTEGVRSWADAHEQRMLRREGDYSCSEIYGANLSIRRDRFASIGGYRTDLRRTEDFQLGKKIIEADCKIVFSPTARVEQVYDKTIPEWCDDFYQDGISHYRLLREFPDERLNLKLGHYHPQSMTKRILRPLVIRDRILGRWIIAFCKRVLELARRRGLRWRLLSSVKGVIGDALFWKGVYDELGDPRRFRELIEQERVGSSTRFARGQSPRD